MEELVWCFVGTWGIAVIVYFLCCLACKVKIFLAGIFKSNETE